MVGAGCGFGLSFWVMRGVRGAVDRYRPERVTSDLAGAIRSFGGDLRSAASEGRAAMRDAEADLRSSIHHS